MFELLLTFDGRIRRRDYWLACLCWSVMGSVTSLVVWLMTELGQTAFVDEVATGSCMLTAYSTICVVTKRLHDLDRSGWWQLIVVIPFMIFVLFFECAFRSGTDGANQFGPDPQWVGDYDRNRRFRALA